MVTTAMTLVSRARQSGPSLCVPTLRTPACACCVHDGQFVVDMPRLADIVHPVCPHRVRPCLPPSCARLRHVLALCILALCSPCSRCVCLLRVPLLCACAVRLRAGRVVCLCSIRLDRAEFARQFFFERHRHHIPRRHRRHRSSDRATGKSSDRRLPVPVARAALYRNTAPP